MDITTDKLELSGDLYLEQLGCAIAESFDVFRTKTEDAYGLEHEVNATDALLGIAAGLGRIAIALEQIAQVLRKNECHDEHE